MGWWIALGVVVLLAALPLGVRVRYDAGGALVRVILGPVKFTVFPLPRKKKKEKKPEEPAKTEEKKGSGTQNAVPAAGAEGAEAAKPAAGGKWTDFLPLARVALDFLGDFRRKLRLNNLELKLILAADDPCDLAVNYGRAWAAVGNLMPRLERLFVIKKRNVEVECDFTASDTLVTARLDVTITLGRLLVLAGRYGFRALKTYLTIQKKRKGGAVT